MQVRLCWGPPGEGDLHIRGGPARVVARLDPCKAMQGRYPILVEQYPRQVVSVGIGGDCHDYRTLHLRHDMAGKLIIEACPSRWCIVKVMVPADVSCSSWPGLAFLSSVCCALSSGLALRGGVCGVYAMVMQYSFLRGHLV